MNDNGDLRQKIDEARRRLPLPELMNRLGLAEHAKKSARCPLPSHDNKHPSFSVFQGKDGFWFWKCHAGCGEGDEIMFLRKLKRLPTTQAMNLYLDMAGFPAQRPPQSHNVPQFPRSLSLLSLWVSLGFLSVLCPTDKDWIRSWKHWRHAMLAHSASLQRKDSGSWRVTCEPWRNKLAGN